MVSGLFYLYRGALRGKMKNRGAVSIERQLRLALALVLVFLVLWIIHNSVLLSVAQRRISENQTQRLSLLGQIVRSELEGRLQEALKDPFVIYSLATETGAARIVLMDRNGMGLVDSQGVVKPGESVAQLGIEPSELLSVWGGGVKLSDPYHDDTQTTVRSLFL